MANGILKGIAIAAGTGLAMGFTSGRTRSASRARQDDRPDMDASSHTEPLSPDSDEMLNIEPLLDRLERLEERMEALVQPVPASVANPDDYAAALSELEWRIDENARELALLRERIEAAELRAAESAAAAQKSAEQVRAEIPAIVERQVSVRVDELQNRFATEMEESHQRMLETFERAIDEKISSRIGGIEKVLAEQAGSIEALTVRSQETDNNLQRLVTAIEKLCERSQLVAAPPPPEPQGFESQFRDAIRREGPVPIVRRPEPAAETRTVPAPAFTSTEPQTTKKSRFLFGSSIVAAFSVIASRFFR